MKNSIKLICEIEKLNDHYQTQIKNREGELIATIQAKTIIDILNIINLLIKEI